MSKPSHRPQREAIKEQRRQKKQQEKALRSRQIAEGLRPRTPPALPNACSAYASVAQEQRSREEAVSGQMAVLPRLLQRLEKIPDLRDPRRCQHKLTVLLLYGLLMFVFQFASRREVNREMTRPQFEANLRALFDARRPWRAPRGRPAGVQSRSRRDCPELETLPHADTLFWLLRAIDVERIEQAHIELVGRLIRGKRFRRYPINHRYPIAIDGSQRFARDTLWDENLLQRTQGKEQKRHTQYFVYLLEASLAFHNGMVIPLLSEFLEYAQGDTDHNKQDREQRAFHRLSARLKRLFPRLPILLLLDGLYANGPVMARCRQFNWLFMIVLKDKDLPSVWEEFKSLQPWQPENRLQRTWGERHQRFFWVNAIDYELIQAGRQRLSLHVVVCEESWEAVSEEGQGVTKTARHAWLSSRPLTRHNVHERCNLGARYRWGIEAGFLVEKHDVHGCTNAAMAGCQRAARATTTSTPLPWIGTP
jgi:hypothetical protein